MKKLTSILLVSFLLFSCTNSTSNNTDVSTENTTAENCEYSIKSDDIKFTWTAFKTTAKVAVNGSFDKIQITNDASASEITELVMHTNFEISIQSVNSENEERDLKLVNSFFNKLDNSESFVGKVTDSKGNNSEGKLMLSLEMNNISKDVPMTYKVENDVMTLTTSLDLLDWNAKDALQSINEACLDLHKGDDGVSKTWSDMDITIVVPLKKVCQ